MSQGCRYHQAGMLTSPGEVLWSSSGLSQVNTLSFWELHLRGAMLKWLSILNCRPKSYEERKRRVALGLLAGRPCCPRGPSPGRPFLSYCHCGGECSYFPAALPSLQADIWAQFLHFSTFPSPFLWEITSKETPVFFSHAIV